MKDISIIIPYHRNKKMLKNSLKTLSESLNTVHNYEIIIVANNLDYSELEVEIDLTLYKLIQFNRNLFYPDAIQKGIEIASGDYLIFADPDIFYCENWLDNMLKTYSKYDNMGCVGAKLINPINNRILDFGIGYQGYHTIHICRGLPYNHELCREDLTVQSVCSALFLTNHLLYDHLRGMDKEMPYAYCDNDFCLRAREAGYPVTVSANSLAYHKGSTDSQNSKYYAFKYLREDSAAAFFYKNREKYYNDYQQHLIRSFSFFNEFLAEKGYIFVNLSTAYDWTDYLKEIKSLGITILDTYEYVIPIRNIDNLDFTNILSPFLATTKTPIIYFSDNFVNCYGNSLWFSMRDIHNDIVIDRDANIIPCLHIANYFL